MRVVALDPGTTETAMVVWDNGLIEADYLPNMEMRARLKANHFGGADLVAIEMVESFGMAVGKETFETVRWIGRFEECAIPPVMLVYRKQVKLHLCGTHKAKDANISQALRDKHGEKGTAKKPGKLFGISKHLWSALAVADYALEHADNYILTPGNGKPLSL